MALHEDRLIGIIRRIMMKKNTGLTLLGKIDKYFIPCVQLALVVFAVCFAYILYLANTEPCLYDCHLKPEVVHKSWMGIWIVAALFITSLIPKLKPFKISIN
jgi:hypothetical protein